MNFVSLSQLQLDVLQWERSLPEFDIVTGVPRSGLLPAAYLALRRNIRYVEFTHFVQDPQAAVASALVRKINPLAEKPLGTRVLVLDDSAGAACNTIRHFRAQLTRHSMFDLSFGAVYAEAPHAALDHYFKILSKPRIFEWNFCRHYLLGRTLWDIDGAICDEWTGQEQIDDPKYVAHLKNAKPLHLPQLPILGLVTGRLTRYRDLTVNWLQRHGVRFDHLHMYDADTPAERRRASDVAVKKAEVYASHVEARLFVESSVQQAEKIFNIVRKPVLCTDNMRLYKL